MDPNQPLQPSMPASPEKNNKKVIIIAIIGVIALIIAIVLSLLIFNKSNNKNNSGDTSVERSTNTETPAKPENTDKIVPETIASCPGCVFTYATSGSQIHFANDNRSFLDGSQYKNRWIEVVEETEKDYFLGMILDNNSAVIKVFACSLIDNATPYCIEGALNDAHGGNEATRAQVYESNVNIMKSFASDDYKCADYSNRGYQCKLRVFAEKSGKVTTHGNSNNMDNWCVVSDEGSAWCTAIKK